MTRHTLAAAGATPLEWPKAMHLVGRLARGSIVERLHSLRGGHLVIEEQGQSLLVGEGDPAIVLRIHDAAAWGRIALRGAVGAGEAYAYGEWSCSDVTGLVRLLLRNRDALLALSGGLARLSVPLLGGMHALRRNTRLGSRDNIAAHYDLSNAFFERILDPTMTYSAGLFGDGARTMEEASVAKLDRLCRMLNLSSADHLLEIGTGWGSMALHAAQRYGCRVTTTTISSSQFEEAQRRVDAAGLSDRVTVLLRDYRDLDGQYDKLVSVEMIEAVGHEFFDRYFETCAHLLRPGGRFAMQAIIIGEADYARARDSVDFIKAHVFPGCCIPSLSALVQAAGNTRAFRLDAADTFAHDYAKTLCHWRGQLLDKSPEIAGLGMSQTQIRAFDYYLAYCEGGFWERHIDLVQLCWTRGPGS